MRPSRLTVLAALLVLTGFACAKPAPSANAAAEEQAIRAIVTEWNGFLTSKNDSAIAEIYAEDGMLLPPNEPAVSGRAKIREYWAGIWAVNGALALAPQTVLVSPGGDMASEVGTWTFSMPTPAGEYKDTGKYLVSWRKVDGQWKALHDAWNSNNPPAGMAPDTSAAR